MISNKLYFDALVQLVRRRFEAVPDRRRAPEFPLADTLMAGLALFSLKDPSLLAFCCTFRDFLCTPAIWAIWGERRKFGAR